jgi:hypothetical protein
VSIREPNPRQPQFLEDERRLDERRRKAQLRLERERCQLLDDWIAGGGTATEFEAAWPEIRAQLGRFRLMELGDKARQRSLTRFRKQD